MVARETGGRPGAEVALPRGDGGTIRADEELLERALENVVRNAREAAGHQGHVTIEVARSVETLAIEVADDGPGLPLERRESLRPFLTTKSGGLGLGLPITHKIVTLHGGALAFRDAPGGGLIVALRLPIAGPAT